MVHQVGCVFTACGKCQLIAQLVGMALLRLVHQVGGLWFTRWVMSSQRVGSVSWSSSMSTWLCSGWFTRWVVFVYTLEVESHVAYKHKPTTVMLTLNDNASSIPPSTGADHGGQHQGNAGGAEGAPLLCRLGSNPPEAGIQRLHLQRRHPAVGPLTHRAAGHRTHALHQNQPGGHLQPQRREIIVQVASGNKASAAAVAVPGEEAARRSVRSCGVQEAFHPSALCQRSQEDGSPQVWAHTWPGMCMCIYILYLGHAVAVNHFISFFLSLYMSVMKMWSLMSFFVLKVQALEQNEKFGCAAVFCFRNAAPFCLRCTCLWSSSQSSVRWRKFLCAVLPVGIFVCFHSQSTGKSFCVQFYLWVSLCTFSVSLLETVFVHSFTSGYLCVPSQSVYWKQFLCTVLPVGIFVCLPSQSPGNSFCILVFLKKNGHPAFVMKIIKRMHLWCSLCTLYLRACQVRVTMGESGLCCCVCFERLSTPLCVDFSLWRVYHSPSHPWVSVRSDDASTVPQPEWLSDDRHGWHLLPSRQREDHHWRDQGEHTAMLAPPVPPPGPLRHHAGAQDRHAKVNPPQAAARDWGGGRQGEHDSHRAGAPRHDARGGHQGQRRPRGSGSGRGVTARGPAVLGTDLFHQDTLQAE